ncbi:hypothetical protein AAG906_037910 [Vitis piasezkii]
MPVKRISYLLPLPYPILPASTDDKVNMPDQQLQQPTQNPFCHQDRPPLLSDFLKHQQRSFLKDGGIKPNQVTIIGSLRLWIDGLNSREERTSRLIYKMGFDMNVFVVTTLIDMSMKEKYGVEISQEHYSRVLDLLCVR